MILIYRNTITSNFMKNREIPDRIDDFFLNLAKIKIFSKLKNIHIETLFFYRNLENLDLSPFLTRHISSLFPEYFLQFLYRFRTLTSTFGRMTTSQKAPLFSREHCRSLKIIPNR